MYSTRAQAFETACSWGLSKDTAWAVAKLGAPARHQQRVWATLEEFSLNSWEDAYLGADEDGQAAVVSRVLMLALDTQGVGGLFNAEGAATARMPFVTNLGKCRWNASDGLAYKAAARDAFWKVVANDFCVMLAPDGLVDVAFYPAAPNEDLYLAQGVFPAKVIPRLWWDALLSAILVKLAEDANKGIVIHNDWRMSAVIERHEVKIRVEFTMANLDAHWLALRAESEGPEPDLEVIRWPMGSWGVIHRTFNHSNEPTIPHAGGEWETEHEAYAVLRCEIARRSKPYYHPKELVLKLSDQTALAHGMGR